MISMGVFFNNNPTPDQFLDVGKKDKDNDKENDNESVPSEERDSIPKAVSMDPHNPVQNILVRTPSGDHSGYVIGNTEVDGHSPPGFFF